MEQYEEEVNAELLRQLQQNDNEELTLNKSSSTEVEWDGHLITPTKSNNNHTKEDQEEQVNSEQEKSTEEQERERHEQEKQMTEEYERVMALQEKLETTLELADTEEEDEEEENNKDNNRSNTTSNKTNKNTEHTEQFDSQNDQYNGSEIDQDIDDYDSDTSDDSVQSETQNNKYQQQSKAIRINTQRNTTMEIEDDENTINSDKTTHNLTEKEANEIHELHATRYTFNYILNEMNMTDLRKEYEGNPIPKEKSDDLYRNREYLIEFYQQLKKTDPEAKIMEWSEKSSKILEIEDDLFPTDAVVLASFFDGFSRRKKGRIYLRVRVHSSNPTRTNYQMKLWAQLNAYSFQECIIQCENSANIGWLQYTSNFTDIDYLKRFLKENVLNIEWGLKIGSITNTDMFEDGSKEIKTPWKDRIKALSVYVPTQQAAMATSKIANLFMPLPFYKNKDRIPLFAERYLFTRNEYEMTDIPSKKQYKTLLSRQKFHNRNLTAVMNYDFETELDETFIVPSGKELTLRQMILTITSKAKGVGKSARLFRSIDFCADTKELWIGNRKGPGGAAYVYTFYKQFEGEARQMIKGLGTYLASIFGSSSIVPLFSEDHWEATDGWTWDRVRHQFNTPEAQQLSANIHFDPNIALLNFLEEEEKEELEEGKNKTNKQKDKELEAEAELAGQATSESSSSSDEK